MFNDAAPCSTTSPRSKAFDVGSAQVSGPEEDLLEGLHLLVADPPGSLLLPLGVGQHGLRRVRFLRPGKEIVTFNSEASLKNSLSCSYVKKVHECLPV